MTKGALMEVTKNERRMSQLSYWECGCLRRRVRCGVCSTRGHSIKTVEANVITAS